VGRPRLQYLKQVARNTGADSYTAVKIMALQQIQMKSCQPIKRLKDKQKKKKKNNNNKKTVTTYFRALKKANSVTIILQLVNCFRNWYTNKIN
jgi:hypothetical protein